MLHNAKWYEQILETQDINKPWYTCAQLSTQLTYAMSNTSLKNYVKKLITHNNIILINNL